MRKFISLLLLTGTVLWSASGNAVALECKSVLTAEGEPSVSRSLIAFPSSLWAWRRAVNAKYGASYRAWRNAADRQIDCKQRLIEGNSKWVCVRTARPCMADGLAGGRVTLGDETLKPGSKGEYVRTLQKLLKDAGFNVKVDGDYGWSTMRAVREFQKQQGLPVDGRVGPKTKERLLA